jgi:hypothetical protein
MMKFSSGLILLAWVLVMAVAPVVAQEPTRLVFEVTVDGSLVAKPEMRVPSGGEGRIVLDEKRGDALVTFIPTVRGDNVAIAFDIAAGDKEFKPTLVITKTVLGSLRWASSTGGQDVRVQVSWIQ